MPAIGMPAVAITDTNNLFGGMEFSAALREKGMQPIIGCQLAPDPGRRSGGGGGLRPRGSRAADAVVLLVQNAGRLRQSVALLARAHVGSACDADAAGFAGDLCAHADGLILLTGGADGPVGRLLLDGRREAAEALVAQLARRSATASTSSCSGTACGRAGDRTGAAGDLAETRPADRRHQRRLLRDAGHVRGARRAAVHRRGHAPRRRRTAGG